MTTANTFKPVVDAEEAYGSGDWRPILGSGPHKDDWKLYMLGKQSTEHNLTGLILPSFDYNLGLDDQQFMSSTAPCWTDTPDRKLPRHFVPNAFALPLVMYPYLGERKEHWISPKNRANMIGNDRLDAVDTADAFDDLNLWIRKRSGFSQAKKDFFLKAESMKDDPVVPGRSMRYFALCVCRDKETTEPHVAVVGFTTTAYNYLIEQGRWRHEDDGPARDPNWPKYLLGDFTDPKGAIEWHADKIQVNTGDTYETNVMSFTQRREFLDPDQVVTPLKQEFLDKRFLMVDPANWNIPTYDEQVQYMMDYLDPSVTADMIRAACGQFATDIPTSRPERIEMARKSSPDSEQPASKSERSEQPPLPAQSSMAPPASSAPPMPDTPPPAPAAEAPPAAPAASDMKYWAGPPSSTPTKLSPAELQDLVNAGKAGGYKAQKDGVWHDLLSSGLVTAPPAPVEEAPPSVPTDEAPPSVPQDAAPPAVPADVSADAPPSAGEKTIEEMGAELFPHGMADLGPDGETKAKDILQRAYVATDKGVKDLPGDIVQELMQLYP